MRQCPQRDRHIIGFVRGIVIAIVISVAVLVGLPLLGYFAIGFFLEDRQSSEISADCRLVADTLSPPGSANAPLDPTTASPEELADYEPTGLTTDEIIANAGKLQDPSLRRHLERFAAASVVVADGMPEVDGEELNPPGLKEYFAAQQQLRESVESINAACPNL